MAETVSIKGAYPLDADNYDRLYHASDLRSVMRAMVSDGVLASRGGGLEVKLEAGEYKVSTGTAFARGLLIPVDAPVTALRQSELTDGAYRYVVVAARFDHAFRDGAIYTVESRAQSYSPVRNESTWELVLARVDWRGNVVDLRLDPAYCGACSPFAPVDTANFTGKIEAALAALDVQAGEVTTTAPGTEASVTVRKVEGEGAYLDMSIPRGDRGEQGPAGRDGRDGANGVTTPLKGFFTLSVDGEGDLWVETPADEPADMFELDQDGNLYVITQ